MSVAYAVGLLLQFLNHNLLWGETVEGIFLAGSFVMLWVLTVGMAQNALPGYHRRQKAEDGETVSVKTRRKVLLRSRYHGEIPGGRCGITGDGCSDDLYLRNSWTML